MKQPRPATTRIIFSLLFLFLIGCESKNKSKLAFSLEDETIGVVNNEKISLSKFQARFQAELKHYEGLIPPGEENRQALKKLLIEEMINNELISQEATRKGIQISTEELDTSVEEAMSPYQNANFDRQLAAANLSKKEWKDRLHFMLLEKKLLEQEVIQKIPITKREIQTYYKQHRNKMYRPRAVQALNLTLATKAEADALLKLLGRGGRIKDLIQRHSISPDRVNDGDMGFVEKGDVPPEIETALFALSRKNPLSPVVHSQDGYHILKLVRTRRFTRLTLEQAKPKIKAILINQRQTEAYHVWLKKLKDAATIHIDEKMLRTEEGF